MSVVSLLGVKVLNNPAKFSDHYQFEITFECLEQLQKGITISRFLHAEPSITLNRSGVEAHLRRFSYLVSQAPYLERS